MSRGLPVHLTVLFLAWAAVYLPNLGSPYLWDVDEGNNAECAREMYAANNWVVPTFNFQLRTDKPALLYWLQMAAYHAFGVNEFSARLPSALAVLGAAAVLYFLGRGMFGAPSALFAALALLASPGAAGAGHFANPDALLLLCSTAALALFWQEMASPGRASMLAVGACCGLGVLAKGPVGFALPAAVGFLYLLWAGRLTWLLTPRVLLLLLGLVLVAGPWYALVAAETKGLWVREFWTKHNAGRALNVMEGHGGPVVYYLLVLLPGLLPWSVFVGPALWDAWARRADEEGGAARKYLMTWAAVYVAFFSLASTKLPNYVLPAYPALCLLLGHWARRWLEGEAPLPAWLERAGLWALGLAGVGITAGMLIVGSARSVEALTHWAWLGGALLAGAAAASLCLDRLWREGAAWSVTLAGLCFVALVGGGALPALNGLKSAAHLAAALPEDHRRREVRLAVSGYLQPSLVFYSRREVTSLAEPLEVAAFLDQPLPAYAFLPTERLPEVQKFGVPLRVLATRRDLYRGKPVVLVTNQ